MNERALEWEPAGHVRAIAQGIDDGVVILADRKVRWASPRFAELLGHIDAESLVGRPIDSLLEDAGFGLPGDCGFLPVACRLRTRSGPRDVEIRLCTTGAATDWILSLFGNNLRQARKTFHNFVTDADIDEIPDELVFGCDDDRRLAGGNKLLDEFGDCEYQPPPQLSLDDIVNSVCAKNEIEPSSIIGPSRQSRLVRIRADIACEAIAKGVATLAEIGRRLNRSDAAIGKLVRRYSADQ